MRNCRRRNSFVFKQKKVKKTKKEDEKGLLLHFQMLPWISDEKFSQELHCSGDLNLYNLINRCGF